MGEHGDGGSQLWRLVEGESMGQESIHPDEPLRSQNQRKSLCLKSCPVDGSQKVNLKVHKILLIRVIQSAR